jgi:hypothetical protein
MNILTKIRKWTWELPQSLLGLILLPIYKKTLLKSFEYKNQKVYIYDKFPGGISLGYYSLVDYNRKDYNDGTIRQSLKDSINHEYGHSIQSAYLGPLYLPVIGVLSGTHNIICRIKRYLNKKYNYYNFFVEREADILGGVIRWSRRID